MTTSTRAVTGTGVLQMVRAEIDAREFSRWMGGRRLVDQDHAMHCLLTECFGRPPSKEHPENDGVAPQPFRLIMPRDGSNGVLYGYGRAGADALWEIAAICADPLQSRVIPSDKLDSKPMPESWRVGQELGFEVRIRPVARKHRGDDRKHHREIDAFQAEAEQYPNREMKRSREQVYTEWLAAQMERRGGARLDSDQTRLVSFQRTRAYRKAQPGRYSEGPDAVMRGIINVKDSDEFAALLAGGIGRHRAYGYGMLLLRPAGRPGRA